jgi:hypothetical protein
MFSGGGFPPPLFCCVIPGEKNCPKNEKYVCRSKTGVTENKDVWTFLLCRERYGGSHSYLWLRKRLYFFEQWSIYQW